MKIKKVLLFLLLATLFLSTGFFYFQKKAAEKTMESFHIKQLEQQLRDSGKAYLPFLNRSTLRTGLYVLPAGARDNQPVHDLDEVYYILDGKAAFVAGQDTIKVEEGSVLFVAAQEAHHFFDIEEDLKVLVFFSTKEP